MITDISKYINYEFTETSELSYTKSILFEDVFEIDRVIANQKHLCTNIFSQQREFCKNAISQVQDERRCTGIYF